MRKYSSDPKRDLQYGNLPSAKKIVDKIPQSAWKNSKQDSDDTPAFGSQEELDALLGEEFTDVKEQLAIEKLLSEQRGYVKGAFHREDTGDIDIFWGNDYVGLKHIIQQRNKQGIDGPAFVREISDVIKNGKLYQKSSRGNFEILHNGKMVIVAPEYHGNKITFILTAYKTRKSTVN